MQFVRTLLWVLILAAALVFVTINWGEEVPVRVWPTSNGNDFLFEWPVGFVALVFFLLGLVPTWLIHRGTRWRLNRRISHLEAAARGSGAAPRPIEANPPPLQPLDADRPLP